MTFEEFVHIRGPALIRFARLLTNDDDRADDLLQEVMAKVLVKWRRVSAADRPDVYVRRMMVNANSSWWRRRSNRELSVAEPSDVCGRADLAQDIAERDHYWDLLGRLPMRQRAVLVLRYYEDLDDVTIAEVLDISPVTVRVTVLRALATLRERYADCLTPTRGSSR